MVGRVVGSCRWTLVAVAFTISCSPAEVRAKTLYVNAQAGNDAISYAENSAAKPWRSIGRAAWGTVERGTENASEAARAGDVVQIAGGTYTTTGNLTGGGGGRQDVAYNPANSGTAAQPIRFQCIGECRLTFSSGAGPMIGATERHFIEWAGFTIDEATAPTRSDTGPVTFFRVSGGAIESSTLVGNPNWTARNGDNYNGIRLEDAHGVRIVNNLIRDYGGQGGDRNHAGITTYRSVPVLIEHNEVVNCGSGIYLKAAADRPETGRVRFNIIRENRLGLNVLLQPMTEEQPLLIHQNLFIGNREAGLWINQFENGPNDAKWVRFFNNTLVDNVSGIASYNGTVFPAGAHFLFWNNIVAGSGSRIRQDTGDAKANNEKDRHDFDYNVYAPGQWEISGRSQSLSSLRDLGQDRHSVIENPRFASPTSYLLAPASPARTVGRALYGIGGAAGTSIPAGAYITGDEVIGRTTPTRPAPGAGDQPRAIQPGQE